jgi:hypothetical protein
LPDPLGTIIKSICIAHDHPEWASLRFVLEATLEAWAARSAPEIIVLKPNGAKVEKPLEREGE